MNEKEATNESRDAESDIRQATASGYRPLRTITLTEQRDNYGRINWLMLEGNTTVFNMTEAEVLHALSRQIFGLQLNQIAATIHEHTKNAFVSGVNCGQMKERQDAQDRARAARENAVPTGDVNDSDPADEILRTRGRDRKAKAPVIAKRSKKVSAAKPASKVKPAKPAPKKRRR
jgi:hypothetical protein